MEMLIMFTFSGICFAGGFLIAYSIWSPNQIQENGEQN